MLKSCVIVRALGGLCVLAPAAQAQNRAGDGLVRKAGSDVLRLHWIEFGKGRWYRRSAADDGTIESLLSSATVGQIT